MMRPPVQVKPLRRSTPRTGSVAGHSSQPARSDRQSQPPARRTATPRLERPRQAERPASGPTGDASNGHAAELVLKRDEPAKVIARPVTVCVRVRPMTDSELADGQMQVVACDLDAPGKLHVTRPAGGLLEPNRKQETFAFDTVLPGSAGQAAVYNLIGSPLVASLAGGCHGCILAFGPTGCGKSHTLFGGPGEARGLLPRLSEKLCAALEAVDGKTIATLSYLELHNEKVRDLLRPGGASQQEVPVALEVCEHPKVGVFVSGLTRSVVSDAEDIHGLVDYGHKIRVIGSAQGSAQSFRSHAILELHVEQVLSSHSPPQRRHAKLQVVELAGAEHLHTGGSMQTRNGLASLADMIAALAKGERNTSPEAPFRDSKLSWLLSESLMGNCRTALITCVSPASRRADLTCSALRFAESVKRIHTRPTRNEEVHGVLVETLRSEIQLLRHRLGKGVSSDDIRDLEEQLHAARYLEDEFAASFEQLQARALAADQQRRRTLRELGLRVGEKHWEQKVSDGYIYVVNVSLDPLLSGCLTWTMAPGEQLHIGSDPGCEICVDGLGVQSEVCCLRCVDASRLEVVRHFGNHLAKSRQAVESKRRSLFKRSGSLLVNGQTVEDTALVLRSGDVLRVGWAYFFRVLIPASASENDRRLGPRPEDTLAIEASYGASSSKDVQQLRDRLGADKAAQVLGGLRDLKLAVDEANELTEELRGNEDQELWFKGHFLTDPLNHDEETTMVVSLRRAQRHACFGKDPAGFNAEDRGTVVATWTLQDFQFRLEVIREIYDEVSLRERPWGEAGDLDPWQAQSFIPALRARESAGTCHESLVAPEVSSLHVSKQLASAMSASTGTDNSDEPQMDVATILQQLPQLHAELAKAYEIQGIQASELVSVRREIEDLRLNLARTTPSPARRPGDPSRSSGTISPLRGGEEMPLLSKSNFVASSQPDESAAVPEAPAERSSRSRSLTPRRPAAPVWRGAEGPRITTSPERAACSLAEGPLVSSNAGSPIAEAKLQSPKSSMHLEASPQSEVHPEGSLLAKDISFAAGAETIRCYLPQSLGTGCPGMAVAQPGASVNLAPGLTAVRQFSAPVAVPARSQVAAQTPLVAVSGPQTPRFSIGSAAMPQVKAPEPQLTPRGWAYTTARTPPTGGAAPSKATLQPYRYLGHTVPAQLQSPQAQLATPAASPAVLWQVPKVLRTPATPVTATLRGPWVGQPSRSPSPPLQRPGCQSSENVSLRRASTPPAPVGVENFRRRSNSLTPAGACAQCAGAFSAASTPRFMAKEAEAMARAAAAAVAKAAPGMNIVVRPVSPSQVAMLTQQRRGGQRPDNGRAPSPPVAEADHTNEEQLRNCQVELAGLRKEVDSLGQVCRDFKV